MPTNGNHQKKVPMRVFTRGSYARKLQREDGQRSFLPYKVTLELTLSPLSITSDTYVFYLYQEHAPGALDRASFLLKTWIVSKGKFAPGYPKPSAEGKAVIITDRQFDLTWQQADNNGQGVLKAGDPADPVAYFIKPKSNIIIT